MKKSYSKLILILCLAFSGKMMAQTTCNASFYLDKAASTAFNAILVNNSTGVGIVPPDSLIFNWYWGDGTSTLYTRYPTHSYSSPGTKMITMIMFNNYNSCSDSAGVVVTIDSMGVFHKTNATYNMSVVAPGASGISKSTVSMGRLNSTLVKDAITYGFSANENGKIFKADLFSYDGKNVLTVNEKIEGNKFSIPVSGIQSGVYFMNIEVDGRSSVVKFVKE